MHEPTEHRIHKRRERPEGRSLHIRAHACVPYYHAVPNCFATEAKHEAEQAYRNSVRGTV